MHVSHTSLFFFYPHRYRNALEYTFVMDDDWLSEEIVADEHDGAVSKQPRRRRRRRQPLKTLMRFANKIFFGIPRKVYYCLTEPFVILLGFVMNSSNTPDN